MGATVPLVGGDQKGYQGQGQKSALCLHLTETPDKLGLKVDSEGLGKEQNWGGPPLWLFSH